MLTTHMMDTLVSAADKEAALIALLEVPENAKHEACRKLASLGTQASVAPLAAMLEDARLSHMARYALERIPAPEAAAALRDALPKLSGALKVGVIASLGARDDDASVSALAGLIGDDDAAVARAAAAAIRKLGDADLVIFGKEMSDSASDQHVFQTARKLGWTMIGFVAKIEAIDFAARTIRVRRMTDQGTEVVNGCLPAVISVLKDINEPKYPTFIGIRKAAKAEIPVWSLADLGLSAAAVAPKTTVSGHRELPKREGSAEIIEGTSAQEQAARLVARLLEEKVL